MRRITNGHVIYVQDGYNFNMYVLDPDTMEFSYQLSICKTDDYHIGCEVDLSEEREIKICINENSLFYPGFLSFMDTEHQITIQDDLGYHRFGKQVSITKNEEDIELLFEYKEKQNFNPFSIHILNVAYNGRSLIDQQGKDTKERLYTLSDELFSTFEQYDSAYDGPIFKKVKR